MSDLTTDISATTLTEYIVSNNISNDRLFGTKVSIDGDYFATGRLNTGSGTEKTNNSIDGGPRLYIYNKNNDVWSHNTSLPNSGDELYDGYSGLNSNYRAKLLFGQAFKISSDNNGNQYIAIGMPGDFKREYYGTGTSRTNSGTVIIYKKNNNYDPNSGESADDGNAPWVLCNGGVTNNDISGDEVNYFRFRLKAFNTSGSGFINDPQPDRYFGSRLDFSYPYIAVCNKPTSNTKVINKVYIFKHNTNTDIFEPNGLISLSDLNDQKHFGYDLKLLKTSSNGDEYTLAVGAKEDNGDTGAVYVFTKDVNDNWSQYIDPSNNKEYVLPDSNHLTDSNFGHQVSLSYTNGDKYLFASEFTQERYHNGTEWTGDLSGGSVFIFKYENNRWNQIQLLKSDEERHGRFGEDIAAYEDTLLISDPFHDHLPENSNGNEDHQNTGLVFLYKLNENNIWNIDTKYDPSLNTTANAAHTDIEFGRFLDMDSENIIIGAPEHNDPSDDTANSDYSDGAVYITSMAQNLTSARICLLGNTPVLTDQGKILIKKITINNTINGRKILKVTKNRNSDNYMILVKKNSIGLNIPSKDIYISKNHCIFINNKLTRAIELVNKKNIIKVKRGHDIIYNIVLEGEEQGYMKVNNMIVETLHPSNFFAKL